MLTHTLPTLPYSYDALEPHIDALTMEIHHSRHHQTYITNYLKLLEGTGITEKYTPEELIRHLDEVPADKKQGVINNLGGHLNHSFFWTILTPNPVPPSPTPTSTPLERGNGELMQAITVTFESFEKFQEQFTQKTMTMFGSGWAWLVKNAAGELVIKQATNQNSPLMDGDTPIIGIDVWEHAYYLKHQNKRADYITSFWNVVNWEQAEKNFTGQN